MAKLKTTGFESKLATTDKSLLEGFSQQLTCSICLEHYNIPKTLTPCLHTFCQECLQETINSTATIIGGKGTFPCPKCRGNVEFDCPDLSTKKNAAETQFRINFDIQSQLEMIKSTITNGCSKHTGEILLIFCKDCKKAICQKCLLEDDHLSKQHVLTSIKEEAQKIKSLYKCNCSAIQQRCSNNKRILSQNHMQQKRQNEIKTSAEKLIKILDITKQQMSTFILKEKECIKQTSIIEANINQYQDYSDKLEELMSGNDVQLVLRLTEISDVIKNLKQMPAITAPAQLSSAGQVPKIFLTLSDQLKQLAASEGWKCTSEFEKTQMLKTQLAAEQAKVKKLNSDLEIAKQVAATHEEEDNAKRAKDKEIESTKKALAALPFCNLE
ncbi:E3 ubiquitin-protein ligase TRIM17-like [Amphiura filiformis]|uniref:E3 ubiquitin-protein ligase TRIM17-like n=1 Tax=Amphiura filiformis TaxID=82378 RepID=UPI003B2168D2